MKNAIVIGGGPAGLTAALYLARAAVDVTVFEKAFYGGKITETFEIENYPGFELVSGFELSEKIRAQAVKAGVKTVNREVLSLTKTENGFTVKTNKDEMKADAVIFAAGTEKKMLGVKGEAEFSGRGVSYCALCDGGFYKGKTVFVIGGGNTAVEDALYLASLCKEVFLVHRRDEFRAENAVLNAAKKVENLNFITGAELFEIKGEKSVNEVLIKTNQGVKSYAADGVFIAIGANPKTELLEEFKITDENGYIIADREGVTSACGLFAAGDSVKKNCRQIVTAIGDGASAANSAINYLKQKDA